jgi:trans-2-enoyl-CoA reductase
MSIKQEHSSTGDNVAGDKNVESNFYISADNKSITSKITVKETYKQLNFADDVVLEAFKETVIDLIKEEEQKCHNIVPISHVRNHYKQYIDDELFQSTLKSLYNNKSIEISQVQVCYIPKDLNYSIDI